MAKSKGDKRRRVPAFLRAKSSCNRCHKIAYTSQEAAETAATLRALGDPRYPDELRVYACPAGRGWHLTSQPQRTSAP